MVDILKKIVGGHIRELRKKAGFRTVESFAEALGVHPNSVGELERGANWISPEMLEKLVTRLDLPPSAFFPGPVGKPPQPLKEVPRVPPEILEKLARCDEFQLAAINHTLDLFDRDRPTPEPMQAEPKPSRSEP